MRKLLNIITFSAIALLVSCDMDKTPQNGMDQKEAFKDIEGIEYLEKGAYARLKDIYSPSHVTVADIQADYVNAVSGYSNTYGQVYKWEFQQSEDDITVVWQNCYLAIGQCNYVLDGIDESVEEGNFIGKGDAFERLELVRGRMHLIRAMAYSILAERYCADYDASTAQKEYSGVPLVKNHLPGDKPGRSSLYDIYQLILEDIGYAKTALAQEAGSANSVYLNRDCVTALEAHVYLQMDMYKEAFDAAKSLIDNGAYGLADSQEEFNEIWTYDRGKEIIFKFPASKTELPYSYGYPFYNDKLGGNYASEGGYYWSPDYIPTQSLVDAFEKDDYRTKSWLDTRSSGGPVRCYAGRDIITPGYTMISKFPGNPDLRTNDGWNFVNSWKVFRIAEMYLIAAEAAIQSDGDAKTPLNTLRQHRGLPELETVTFDDIKEERYKELMLEGFRLVDLKRWGDGMKRGKSQYGKFTFLNDITGEMIDKKEDFIDIGPGRELEAQAGDFHFVWPIPYNETYSNQNLANQQNPGWER